MGTIFTCPHCSAVYFIDWNGQPEMAQHEVEPHHEAEVIAPADNPEEPSFQEGSGFQNFQPPEHNAYDGSAGFEPPINNFADDNSSNEIAPEPYVVHGEEMPAEVEVEVPPAQEPAHEESAYDFSQTLDSIPEPIAASGVSDTPDFSDVTDFANANSEVGPFSYTVVIEGIESSHHLLQLKEAMTDSRFGWDLTEVLNTVGEGRLVIPRLSPAKASVLVNRIKYLPFKISWRQDVLASS
ncbi:MAG TPA: hypothetical protein VGE46_05785 [Bdellovibrio sp.]